MKFGVLFSGGKDSVFACHLAMQKDEVACLITILSENPDSYMFHTPNIRCTDMQARAMEMPILSWTTKGRKEEELQDLAAAISAARDRYGIEGIVTGAIESVYQAARVQRICRELGLWCCSPLWQINQIDYLRLLLKESFSVIISGVYAYPFDQSWLGAMLSEERIQILQSLQKKYKINPSGEGGELETLVLDGPLFYKRIEILKASQIYAGHRGQFIIEKARLADKTARKRKPEPCGRPASHFRLLQESARTEKDRGGILLIDLCAASDSLFEYEFVHPIRAALKDSGYGSHILHYSKITPNDIDASEKIILCGTALKDDDYLHKLGSLSWIKDFRKPLMGICAGMQAISAVYGGSILSCPAIGLTEIEIRQESSILGEPRSLEVFQLHNHAATLPEKFILLAGEGDAALAFQHQCLPTFGFLFHPEVRCRWILERFAKLPG
ncbi:MAG: diphthine--ammonia ligase [Methanothrix sp.]|nr:diphthine--ammonia ligase [Methanothrix sp.]